MRIQGAFLAGVAAMMCMGQPVVRLVPVEEKVKLEVLDWGGPTLATALSIVLLADLGDTAHVFDDFAPKLVAAGFHVYGITRRGYGSSSAPENGYSADRLGDDVLAVIDALKLDKPVLVGNGLAGEELSSVGSRHPEKVAGLIYLDAAYSYAYYDRTRGDLFFDLLDLERKLGQLYLLLPAGTSPFKKDLAELRKELTRLQASNGLPGDPRFASPARLLESKLIPMFEKDLQDEPQRKPDPAAPARPEPAKTSQERKRLFDDLLQTALPGFEKDLREKDLTAAGPGRPRQETKLGARAAPDRAAQAILQGRQKYTALRIPVLAIYSLPHKDNEADDDADDEAQAKAFESGVHDARVVRLAHASRKVFLSNEADVLREMTAFLGGLQ